MKVVILAGGGGTRLFPLSRTSYPKQFLQIDSEKSLLAQTVERFLKLVESQEILIVTSAAYFHHVQAELKSVGAVESHILLEPVGRNTAPAIAFAIRYCIDVLGSNGAETIFISPSDHVIRSGKDSFEAAVEQAKGAAELGKIVTFGISPDKPETGYGYIHAGKAYSGDFAGFAVESFKEKPDLATAEAYLAAGGYYWNSGMFAFSIQAIMLEFQLYSAPIAELLQLPFVELQERFGEMPDISIDYAVAEKSKNAVIIPFKAYWNDIGSWDAIYEVMDKDEAGNAIKGDCLPLNCSNSLLMSRSRLIAGIGLEDLLVVETDDVILVARKGESQQVKDLVTELKKRKRKEATEHTTMYRPWGSYTVMGEGPGYKMKKIVVTPGQKLSLQLHYHRSEHWVVIGGTARVTVGETEQMVHKNESVFIPSSTKHRLENPGKIPLEIIEVQNGDYLGEDDIVRFEDSYGRV
ncbi:MAG: mannose-1-phosphate guanylyltransferase/mannose-6-phosphate isomerase [Sporomusaceae bacterium]|nr:mannose-1-phosphate guanylyltransferase/mannose-6-phosphate isomerase [Sporomusaceae bacterium]